MVFGGLSGAFGEGVRLERDAIRGIDNVNKADNICRARGQRVPTLRKPPLCVYRIKGSLKTLNGFQAAFGLVGWFSKGDENGDEKSNEKKID